MQIALVNQFYPPDVAPTGHYLHDLARALVERVERVVVLASRRGYGGGGDYPPHELLDGVEVALERRGPSASRGEHDERRKCDSRFPHDDLLSNFARPAFQQLMLLP